LDALTSQHDDVGMKTDQARCKFRRFVHVQLAAHGQVGDGWVGDFELSSVVKIELFDNAIDGFGLEHQCVGRLRHSPRDFLGRDVLDTDGRADRGLLILAQVPVRLMRGEQLNDPFSDRDEDLTLATQSNSKYSADVSDLHLANQDMKPSRPVGFHGEDGLSFEQLGVVTGAHLPLAQRRVRIELHHRTGTIF